MIRKYIIVADDSLKGFDEEIAKLEREWGAEELESCEDCISRQAVLEHREILKDKQGTGYQAVKTKYIRELPSVTPQQIYREKHGVVNYTLSCDKDEMAEFKAICDRKGISRSQVLNKLMREYIAKHKEEEDGKID